MAEQFVVAILVAIIIAWAFWMGVLFGIRLGGK